MLKKGNLFQKPFSWSKSLLKAKAMGRSKENVPAIADKAFKSADDDGSGELSVIEVFCILPDLDKTIKKECRILEFDEYESDTGKRR